ncbi:hypothetical protein [Blautia sp. HCP28S3_G10]
MEEKKEKLILNGNAFYEIDLQCIKKKKQEEEKKKEEQQKRQRK